MLAPLGVVPAHRLLDRFHLDHPCCWLLHKLGDNLDGYVAFQMLGKGEERKGFIGDLYLAWRKIEKNCPEQRKTKGPGVDILHPPPPPLQLPAAAPPPAFVILVIFHFLFLYTEYFLRLLGSVLGRKSLKKKRFLSGIARIS